MSEAADVAPPLLTVAEARKELFGDKLGRNGIYEAIARGEIPIVRVGERIFVPRNALELMQAKAAADAEAKTRKAGA